MEKGRGRENGKKGDRENKHKLLSLLGRQESECCLIKGSVQPRKIPPAQPHLFYWRFSPSLSYFLPREDTGFHAGLSCLLPPHPFNQALLQSFAMPRGSSPLTDQI